MCPEGEFALMYVSCSKLRNYVDPAESKRKTLKATIILISHHCQYSRSPKSWHTSLERKHPRRWCFHQMPPGTRAVSSRIKSTTKQRNLLYYTKTTSYGYLILNLMWKIIVNYFFSIFFFHKRYTIFNVKYTVVLYYGLKSYKKCLPRIRSKNDTECWTK